jgi:hypothetical protein
MAHGEAPKPAQTKLVIRNIGLLLSGDLAHAILDADTIVALAAASPLSVRKEMSTPPKRPSRSMPKERRSRPVSSTATFTQVCGDWTPRQNQLAGLTAT